MFDLASKIKDAPLGKTWLFFVGQTGYIIKNKKGELLAVDLYLTDSLEKAEGHDGFKRLLAKLITPEEIAFDYVIATHPHYDHLDIDAVPGYLSHEKTKLFASVNCEQEIKNKGLTNHNIEYYRPGDFRQAGDYKIHFINCDHGTGAPDAFGLIIETDSKRILLVGDTCLRLDRVPEYTSLGPIDIMIAPINGAYGNLNEAECAQLANEVKPKITIPAHYGMFARHGGNPGLFKNIMLETYNNKNYCFMTQGEQMEI